MRWERAVPVVFVAVAIAFGVSAIFHVAAIASPDLDPSAPAWRHGLFIGINLACAAGFILRPRAFIPAFGALVVQQLASHGAMAWNAWHLDRHVDVASLAVLLFMPAALVLLIADARARPRRLSQVAPGG